MDFAIKDYSLLDDIGPEKIIILKNPSTDLKKISKKILIPFLFLY